MNNISVSLSKSLKSKLMKLAKDRGCSFDEVVGLALTEYVENAEDSFKVDLSTVSSTERSFFVSLGK